MAIELVLLKSVDGLGQEGEIVRVADGYARNFLLPRSLGTRVTDVSRRQLEKKQKDAEVRKNAQRDTALKLAARLNDTQVTVKVKVGDEGKLFGSVTAADIADALKAQGVEIDRHSVGLSQPIREIGKHKVHLKIMPEIHADIRVVVEAE